MNKWLEFIPKRNQLVFWLDGKDQSYELDTKGFKSCWNYQKNKKFEKPFFHSDTSKISSITKAELLVIIHHPSNNSSTHSTEKLKNIKYTCGRKNNMLQIAITCKSWFSSHHNLLYWQSSTYWCRDSKRLLFRLRIDYRKRELLRTRNKVWQNLLKINRSLKNSTRLANLCNCIQNWVTSTTMGYL